MSHQNVMQKYLETFGPVKPSQEMISELAFSAIQFAHCHADEFVADINKSNSDEPLTELEELYTRATLCYMAGSASVSAVSVPVGTSANVITDLLKRVRDRHA